MNIIWLIIFIVSAVGRMTAKDLGTHGHVSSIEEENLKEVLQKRAQANPKALEDFQKDLVEQAKYPAPIKRLQEAVANRAYFVDFIFTLEQDLKNEKGEVIHQAGKQVSVGYNFRCLHGYLFIDGDNEEHVTWALQQEGRYNVCLVKGDPSKIQERTERHVFFDLKGQLADKFEIKAIPARARQYQDKFLIEECCLKDPKFVTVTNLKNAKQVPIGEN